MRILIRETGGPHQVDAVPDEPPQRHGVDGPVQLGQTVQHHALQPLHARAQPAGDVLCGERRGGDMFGFSGFGILTTKWAKES